MADMELEVIAKRLAEMGHPARLATIRLLVQAGPEGLPVGDIQAHLGIPASTLSHHLSRLVAAGLVEQNRDGRVLRCTADYEALKGVLGFLMRDCCAGVGGLQEE